MGVRRPCSPPVPLSRPLAAFPLSFLCSQLPVPSLSSRPGRGCHRPPGWKPDLVGAVGSGHGTPFLGISSGVWGALLSPPKPVSGVALTPPAWTPDPAQVQMFTGSLLPTASPPLGGPKGKSTRSVRRHHSRRPQSTCSFSSLFKKMKVKEKKNNPANLEHFLEKNYLKLSSPDQHPPTPLQRLRALSVSACLHPSPPRAAPPARHRIGFQGLFQTTAKVTEGPAPAALDPGSINLHVAP